MRIPSPKIHGVSVIGVAVGTAAVSALAVSLLLTEFGERLLPKQR